MKSCQSRALCVLVLSLLPALGWAAADDRLIDEKVRALLEQMTLEEKAGQLTQYSSNWTQTGPASLRDDLGEAIEQGQVGALLNVTGARRTRQFQERAMRSRLKIPLLFGLDVIHGYKTTFPIPLAEAASWDLAAIERSARIAATEAAAGGIHWTFAPMVDIARDPRWGRVMEGAGEDSYLGSLIAAARVRGFQGTGLGELNAVMACAKHFAAYGAAQGGREYNSVDMSERMLWETYLPPFQAAAEAGAATFMNSFNDLNGIPATGNRTLQREILKGRWDFQGFVVSDWDSIGQMVQHGFARDGHDAARLAIVAGNDMDMQSSAYRRYLPDLVSSGQVPLALVDEAVRRVLHKKFELGLFDDPYRFSDPAREQAALNDPEHAKAARKMAASSIVLLKNTANVLPLSRSIKTIAFIGPMVKAGKDNLGGWAVNLPEVDYSQLVVSQWDGLRSKLGEGVQLLYAKGCDFEGEDRTGFAEAVDVARQADAVVVSVGERWTMSGEARSRSNIHLPGVQEDLIKAVQATGKPVVVLVNAGRPLIFNWTADNATAILYTWFLGSEAGNAIADVLVGEVDPSGKLPITFPRSEGQIPLYYDHFNTGRPDDARATDRFVTGYIDLDQTPRYPFGFGLSYTTFAYSDGRLSSHDLRDGQNITVTLDVRNAGRVAGDEVVQLYLHQKAASVVRPVLQLRDFRRVHLEAGQTEHLSFQLDREKLSFINARLQRVTEPGEFELMIGSSSADIRFRDVFTLSE